jgi:SAM-dependent methyltransferase
MPAMTTDVAAAGAVLAERAVPAQRRTVELRRCHDPITIGVLQGVGLHPGARVLELGCGSGSIGAWLADQVAASGSVVVVDPEPDVLKLDAVPNLHIHPHDLRCGLPGDLGGFELVHARGVLAGLPNRHHLLRELVDLLIPGGWVVLGELASPSPVVYTPGRKADAALFTRVLDVSTNVLLRQPGLDPGWARGLYPALAGAGLRQLRLLEHAESWTGASAGSRLHSAIVAEQHARMISAGLTASEIEHFHRLMNDPSFAFRSWPLWYASGRKPGTG